MIPDLRLDFRIITSTSIYLKYLVSDKDMTDQIRTSLSHPFQTETFSDGSWSLKVLVTILPV